MDVSWPPPGPDGWSITAAHVGAGSHRHEPVRRLQLRLVRQGSSYAEVDLGIGARRVFTRPGDLLLSLPGSPTSFHIDSGRDLLVLQIEESLVEALIRRAGGVGIDALTALTAGPFREALVAELCRRLSEVTNRSDETADAALLLVVDALLRRANSRREGRGRHHLTTEGLRSVLATIDERLPRHISVEQLAKVTGLPRRVLAAEFKVATGIPVYQFVLRKRLELATRLLVTTDMPLVDVAAEAGFAHQAHLNRVARRLTGLTPIQLREGRNAAGQ